MAFSVEEVGGAVVLVVLDIMIMLSPPLRCLIRWGRQELVWADIGDSRAIEGNQGLKL